MFFYQGVEEGETDGEGGWECREERGNGEGKSDRRIENRKGVRLSVLRKRQGWGVGPLANKVWIQPVSLAGSGPRPCGHEDLSRILRPQVIGESDAAEEGSVRKQEQSERRSRASVHCHMNAGEDEVQ